MHSGTLSIKRARVIMYQDLVIQESATPRGVSHTGAGSLPIPKMLRSYETDQVRDDTVNDLCVTHAINVPRIMVCPLLRHTELDETYTLS